MSIPPAPEPSQMYRVWYDNWDAYVDPVTQPDAADQVESEMRLCSKAMLVTRGDLTRDETLAVVENLRKLIEMSFNPMTDTTPEPIQDDTSICCDKCGERIKPRPYRWGSYLRLCGLCFDDLLNADMPSGQ